jgi:hypothetical protein
MLLGYSISEMAQSRDAPDLSLDVLGSDLGRHTESPDRVFFIPSLKGAYFFFQNKESRLTKSSVTNHLLFFDTTRTAWKKTPPKIPGCSGKVSTEPLPSNDRGIHRPTDTSTQKSLYCCVYTLPRERVQRAFV